MFLQVGLLVLSMGAIVQVRTQIVGSYEAPDHKYPYMVSFRDLVGEHYCGGAIISSSWILTAAHCFEIHSLLTTTIFAGSNYLDEKGVIYQGQSVVRAPGYKAPFTNDIALVRVKSEILLGSFVATIALPSHDLNDYSQTGVFTGWGSMHDLAGPYPNALQEIKLNILSMERCRATCTSITDSHLCTLNKLGEGICYEDSGGPLVINGEVVGIASRGTPCAKNEPDVFIRVWSFKNWIVSTIAHHE